MSLLFRMREERASVLCSSERSTSRSSASTADRLDWVDMEDCRRALDISSACTLRSRRESRYGSLALARLCCLRWPRVRRVRREVGRGEAGRLGGRLGMKTSESLGSVSSSASSALSGYAGGCSEGISGRSGCLCLGGEV